MSELFVVITSIQAPTESVIGFERALSRHGGELLLVADRKTPEDAWKARPGFLAMEAQRRCAGLLAPLLPMNHYSRKNLGYLEAIQRGAGVIFDTDDDNAPTDHWAPRTLKLLSVSAKSEPWANVYPYFGANDAWPRGLPLEFVRKAACLEIGGTPFEVQAPIQQGLANGSPDVDAVWRLLSDRDVQFLNPVPLSLSRGSWCPFNSQSTWWFPEAYALLYLPSNVSFRMTDIWRSFVAQRCLWAMGKELAFTGPEVFQDRNEHNLLRDFEQEVPGYLGNERIRRVLEDLDLESGPGGCPRNVMRCYEALIAGGFIPEVELELLRAWLGDFERSMSSRASKAS